MYQIAVIGGDGYGPEVTREAVKVLDAAAGQFQLKLNYTPYDVGGDRYLRTGEVLPDSVLTELRKFPAILLGAIGHPGVKPGILEKGILLRARFELEQYINLRPVKLYANAFAPSQTRHPNTSISSSSARTPRPSISPPAALSSKAPPTRSPSRKASTPGAASSAASASPSTTPASATRPKNSPSPARPTS